MERKTETRQFGDDYFKVTALKARQSNRLLERLVNLSGPMLGNAAAGLGTKATKAAIGDLSPDALGKAITGLCGRFDGEQINDLIEALQESIMYQTPELHAMGAEHWVPSKDIWDDRFAGRLGEQLRVLAFALEVNYADFFGGFGGIVGAAKAALTPTETPTE